MEKNWWWGSPGTGPGTSFIQYFIKELEKRVKSRIFGFEGDLNGFCITSFSVDKCDFIKNLIPTYML